MVDEDLRAAVAHARDDFAAAMADDFNTRGAVSALLELATAVNRHVDAHDDYDYRGLVDAIETFEDLGGGVLGFQFGDAEVGGDVSIAEDVVDLVLDVREAEREAGNYERADDLRDRLEALGVTVEDTDDGATFRL